MTVSLLEPASSERGFMTVVRRAMKGMAGVTARSITMTAEEILRRGVKCDNMGIDRGGNSDEEMRNAIRTALEACGVEVKP